MIKTKINLISLPGKYFGIKSNFLEFLFKDYFNFLEYDETASYDKHNSLFIKNIFQGKEWGEQMADKGYKVVVDNLPEIPVPTKFYCLTNKNWFWYRESLLTIQHNYNLYQPTKSYKKLAFMPINRVKPERDELVLALKPFLQDFIYSYQTQSLPGDISKEDNLWQRYFNPDWYDQTYFSLVVETTIKEHGFITEKTFKPIAYKHPFLIFGQQHTLNALKNLGFETYNNLFDESYDTTADIKIKINQIIDNVKNFKQEPYDYLTLEKLEHNHNLFFNKELVIDKIKKEIIEPLIEYATTT